MTGPWTRRRGVARSLLQAGILGVWSVHADVTATTAVLGAPAAPVEPDGPRAAPGVLEYGPRGAVGDKVTFKVRFERRDLRCRPLG
jgi:hypothetical protein